LLLVDLFCGLKSLKPVCNNLGIDYFGVDIDPQFKPDLCIDIKKLTPRLLKLKPDIIWASPPCEHFSVSSIGRHWYKDNTPKTVEASDSAKLVIATLNLIKELNPLWFWIENPRGKLRKLPFMQVLPIRHTITYCQYGDFRMKPTDIWTNNNIWVPKPMCKNGDSCHVAAPRGSTTGTQGKLSYEEKSKVPYQLLLEILKSCIKEQEVMNTYETR
jgi:hypothetical protein